MMNPHHMRHIIIAIQGITSLVSSEIQSRGNAFQVEDLTNIDWINDDEFGSEFIPFSEDESFSEFGELIEYESGSALSSISEDESVSDCSFISSDESECDTDTDSGTNGLISGSESSSTEELNSLLCVCFFLITYWWISRNQSVTGG